MFHRKRSIFPLLLALVTIGLIVFVVYSVKPSDVKQAEQEQAITDEMYLENLKKLVDVHKNDYQAAETNWEKNEVAKKSLEKLLDLKVTSGYKDLHLEIAQALLLMQNDLELGKERFEEAIKLIK